MSDDLHNYIRQAQQDGTDHQTIKDRLVRAGWHPQTVGEALDMQTSNTREIPNAPSESSLNGSKPAKPQNPIAVVQTLSTRGVEYYLMLIALAASAVSLGLVLHSIAGELLTDASAYAFAAGMMSFASASLIVSLPIFIFLFLRLKKAELLNPRLRLDPSRRRGVQITLILTFIVGLFSAIGYVFTFFNAGYGGLDAGYNIGLTIADLVITAVIVGGIFAYYWIDSHPKGEL